MTSLDLSLARRVDRRLNPYFRPDLYWIGWHFSNLLFDVGWRRKVIGRSHIPPAGTGVIFAANHRSNADPNVVGSCVPYPIFYFAKEELFQVPLVGWWIRRVNSLPVRRQAQDVGAFRSALAVLKHGRALLMFPEGGRRHDPHRQFKARAGVGMLAIRAQVPVVPVGVLGTDRFSSMARITVHFGAMIHPPKTHEESDYQKFSDHIMTRIKELCHA